MWDYKTEKANFCGLSRVAIGPAPHTGSPELFGPGTPEESEKNPERATSTPGQGPKSPQRVRPGVSKKSEKSLKPDFRTLFGLFGDSGVHSLGDFWGPGPGHSFRTLFGLFRGSRPEELGRPCVGRGQSQPSCTCVTLACALAGALLWEHWWVIFRFRQLCASLRNVII